MKTYTIKDVAQMFNIPASTLRYYEEVGILTNIERTNSKQRIYTECHINRLKTICCFKGTGMSIAKLQAFFAYEERGLEEIDSILELLNNQKNEVEEQLEQLNKDFQHIKRKLNYYSDIKSAKDEGKELPCWDKYRGKKYSSEI